CPTLFPYTTLFRSRRASRSYGIQRRARNTFCSSNPKVEIKTVRGIDSAHQEFRARCGADQVRPRVFRIRRNFDHPLREELLHMVVHRALVDAEGLRERGLVRRVVSMCDEVREDRPLLL